MIGALFPVENVFKGRKKNTHTIVKPIGHFYVQSLKRKKYFMVYLSYSNCEIVKPYPNNNITITLNIKRLHGLSRLRERCDALPHYFVITAIIIFICTYVSKTKAHKNLSIGISGHKVKRSSKYRHVIKL